MRTATAEQLYLVLQTMDLEDTEELDEVLLGTSWCDLLLASPSLPLSLQALTGIFKRISDGTEEDSERLVVLLLSAIS